jgi:hypothetical protein
MVDKHSYSVEALRNSLQDMLRRRRMGLDRVRALGEAIAGGEGEADLLPALGAMPSTRELLRALATGLRDMGPLPLQEQLAVPSSEAVDYLLALEQDLPRHKRKK